MLNVHHMHTWVCTVFTWNYEQHLYTHTLIPIINRFASTNEPLSIESHFVSGAWKFAILSDAIHMAREHWPNAIQYSYLHLFTTKFVAILLTLTQKYQISQISNVQKVRHLEQPADGWRTERSRCVIHCKLIEQKIDILIRLIIVNTATS